MCAKDLNLKDSLVVQPPKGQSIIQGDRMLSFSPRAIRSLYELLYKELGDTRTHAFLARFGYRCGQDDYEAIRKSCPREADHDFIAGAPFVQMWGGLVQADPQFVEYDRATGHFHMHGHWRNSYEVSLNLELNGPSSRTNCFSLTGYVSGWASAFFGKELLAIETMCESHGDPHCRFEIRPAAAWGPQADLWRHALGPNPLSVASKPREKLGGADPGISNLAVIDDFTFEALKTSLDDIAVTRELVESFILDANQLVSQILEGDQVTARRAAHTLKSTAPVFGARRLASLAAQAENTAPIRGPMAQIVKQALADVVSQLRISASQD